MSLFMTHLNFHKLFKHRDLTVVFGVLSELLMAWYVNFVSLKDMNSDITISDHQRLRISHSYIGKTQIQYKNIFCGVKRAKHALLSWCGIPFPELN